jgi:hypothetical protein
LIQRRSGPCSIGRWCGRLERLLGLGVGRRRQLPTQLGGGDHRLSPIGRLQRPENRGNVTLRRRLRNVESTANELVALAVAALVIPT